MVIMGAFKVLHYYYVYHHKVHAHNFQSHEANGLLRLKGDDDEDDDDHHHHHHKVQQNLQFHEVICRFDLNKIALMIIIIVLMLLLIIIVISHKVHQNFHVNNQPFR